MGSTFRYIADRALRTSDLGPCHHCGREDAPAFAYRGEIVNPDFAADPELAREEPEVEVLCAACIHGGNVRKSDEQIVRMRRIVETFARDPETAIRAYHEIPHVPLMPQDEDWPMCCGDWCEFIGNPSTIEAAVDVPHQHEYWDHAPSAWSFDFDLKPESLREVCLFACRVCGRSYFIWQPT